MNVYNYPAIASGPVAASPIARVLWASGTSGAANALHASAIKPTGDFTVAFRAALPGSTTNNLRWFGIGEINANSANSIRILRNNTDGTRVMIQCFNSAATNINSAAVAVARSGYATWALVRSGNVFTLYADGVSVTSVTAASVNLGSASFGLFLPFQLTTIYQWGRYYDAALSAAEVAMLDSTPRATNLVSRWDFQDQTLNVADRVGSNTLVFAANSSPYTAATTGAGYNALSGSYHTQASFIAQDVRQVSAAGTVSWVAPTNLNLERIVIGWQELSPDMDIDGFSLRYRINGISWVVVARQNLAGVASNSGLVSQRINVLVPAGQTIEVELTQRSGTSWNNWNLTRPIVGLVY